MAENKPEMPASGTEFEGPEGLDAVPGMARIALSAWLHTTEWALKNSMKLPRLMIEVARSPTKGLELLREVGEHLPDPTRTEPEADQDDERAQAQSNGQPQEQERERLIRSLRDEGETLLRKSRDVRYDIDSHPAYERIMGELAPDEARILRLLLLQGPQAAIDVRTGGPVGMLSSRLIAPGLSMIGPLAGCRYVDQVPSYLNNLFRLGMVWFSRETLRSTQKYQVLEAQPDVAAAMGQVRHAKLVRRSIHLTPFGEDFCRSCLIPEERDLSDLPAHSTPIGASKDAPPPSEALSEE
ncbi:MAG: Abi-alpha family protein [Actinomycetota bacterium]|nr:Abi-alpha family protein [Actinomycetota bacterium]